MHIGFENERRHKVQLKTIIDRLNQHSDLLDVLCTVHGLPPARYPADQWAVAKSLFRILRGALIQLQLVFAERGECDFTEVSLLARHALSEASGSDDFAAALGARLQHLLVDEMQDTSTSQYDLIERLTATWDGHSQTVFLVGDPRQSIYLFRQARVERFMRATRTGRLGTLPLTCLQLTANFRSQEDLVARFNEDFRLIFPQPVAADPYALPYSPAHATLPASPNARAVVWHPHPLPYVPRANGIPVATPATTPPWPNFVIARQSATLARFVASHRHGLPNRCPPAARRFAMDPARIFLPRGPLPFSFATGPHLAEIVAEFENDKLGKLPYRAVEITPLNECQEILDLTALTRAIFHPADRVAVLAVLRAPLVWPHAGRLHLLTGSDDPGPKRHSILRLIVERRHLLPVESQQRLDRVQAVLEAAVQRRSRLTTAQLVELAWRSLGGDAWLSETELTNARRYFHLLDSLEAPGGIDPTLLDESLKKLYAEPNPIPSGTPLRRAPHHAQSQGP